jgi:hypothetical protein
VTTAIPARHRVGIDQAEVGLVDQVGGLKRLTWQLMRQPPCRQLPEFLVNQREELLGCLALPVLDGNEDPRHIVHRRRSPWLTQPAASAQPRPIARTLFFQVGVEQVMNPNPS